MITKNDFQLCNSVNETEALSLGTDKKRFLANIKFDGCRIMAIKKDGDVILLNRRGSICNRNLPEIVDELKQIEQNFVIDGEMISEKDEFEMLQKRILTKDINKIKKLVSEVPVKYMIFDILSILKEDEKGLNYNQLSDRLPYLDVLFKTSGKTFKFCELAEYKPVDEMLKLAKAEDREGIIVKDMFSRYTGNRSNAWLKCKFWLEETIRVIKFEVNPKGITCEDDKGNRVLVAGEQSKEVKETIDLNGFADIQIQFLEKTEDNRFRFPSYRGLKTDKVIVDMVNKK